MANKTLLQTRTDYPAVTPIDPDECIILDQQTDQPEGEQSTVATLSELIATGGRTVTKAVAYETLYADSVVNVSASSITITVGSVMRNGSRLLIRRTAAYDGNPVTITPPSGATFEGRASIDLYGQYSYVELERISATVFAIRDLYDEFKYAPAVGITNLPGSWDLNDTRCIRTKGSLIKLFLRYLVTGAATGSINIPKASILPSGIAVRASVFSHPITYRDVSPVDVSGVGAYATSYLTTSTGAYWNSTVPFTWASGDGVFMCLEYEEV